MRILLCHCSSFAGNDISHPRVEHLGIAYLAAVARLHGHTVEILDANLEKLDDVTIVHRILAMDEHFDFIGFSVLSTNYVQTRYVISALRTAGIRCLIGLGGYFPTFNAPAIFRDCPGLDLIIEGEADGSFPQFLEAVAGGDWRNAAGVAFFSDGEIIRTAPAPLVANLDDLPFPARDTLPHLLRHRNPVISVSPARGCYQKCNFCSIIEFYALSKGKAWRERSPDRVVDEIAEILDMPTCRERNVDFVWFCADEFVGLKKGGKSFGQRLAESILKRGLVFRWEIACRTDQVDYDLFRLMKEAGLRSVYVGVESFSQRQLDSYNKKSKVEQNLDALRVFEKLRLDYTMGTIVFSQDTSLEEFEENHRGIQQFGYRHVTMPLSRMKLFEGTPLTSQQRISAQSDSSPVSASSSERNLPESMVRDIWFPLDDVYGYRFDDPRVTQLWWALRSRNDTNEGLVRKVIGLLDDGLLDGVNFWKLVFVVRDGLAWFVNDALQGIRNGDDLNEIVARHDAEVESGLKQLNELREFLERPTGVSFTFCHAGLDWRYEIADRPALYIPGAEKEVAEREHMQVYKQPLPPRVQPIEQFTFRAIALPLLQSVPNEA